MRRRSWFFWFTVVSASFLTLVALSFYAMWRGFRAASPRVGQDSLLALDLSREYPEETLYELGGFFGYDSTTFRDLILALERAKDDARVRNLLIHVRPTSLGWAQASELRRGLLDFKASGKPVVAFLEYASNREYWIASAADEIYIHPRSVLDLRGLRAELLYLREALDKIGVEPEFESIGAYKDAPHMFERREMSPESREAVLGLIQSFHEGLIEALVEGRGLSRQGAEAVLARGPFTAKEAEANDLADGIEYLDEVEARVSPAGEEPEPISIGDYRRATGGSSPFGIQGRIALVYGVGAIVGGSSGEDALFGRIMGSDTIAEAFETVREDDSIDAVVFRIDSPGGSDVASDVIWREAMLTKEKKPVIVSMGEVAASGGYWIATASDRILAEPTTITGSIGIYAGKFNLAGMFDKLGIGTDGVETTENADFFSSSRSFTPEERRRLREILQSGYRAFLERVAESREKTLDEVDALAQGRVWSGRAAQELGLVDELGGLERALEIARERAGIDPEAVVELRIYPEKRDVFELFLENLTRTTRLGAPLAKLDVEEILSHSPLLRLASSGASFALMPFEIDIH